MTPRRSPTDPQPIDLFWAGIALTFGATLGFIAGLAFGV